MMKGLLLKDWYLMKKYCRIYLILIALFVLLTAVDDNLFFLLYPCLLCSLIAFSLQSYDENSRWTTYSQALPYSKKQLVTVKYLIGILTIGAVVLAIMIIQIIKMALNGSLSLPDLMVIMAGDIIASCLSGGICLPLIFKFGSEKGRGVYIATIALFCIIFSLLTSLPLFEMPINFNLYVLILGVTLISMVIYAISWMISVRIYEKREI